MQTPIPWLAHRLLLYKAERKPFSTLFLSWPCWKESKEKAISALLFMVCLLCFHMRSCALPLCPPYCPPLPLLFRELPVQNNGEA